MVPALSILAVSVAVSVIVFYSVCRLVFERAICLEAGSQSNCI